MITILSTFPNSLTLCLLFWFCVYRLFSAGYTIDEIATANLEAQQIKKERAESLERQNWDRFNIFMESALRTLRTVLDAKPTVVGAKMA